MFKDKDARMVVDESGDWTSLSCYYLLHDRVVKGEAHVAALQAENERLRKAGDAMEEALMRSGCSECEGMYDSHERAIDGWRAAKETQP
jgi:hypothetical protein